ncbi:MAG: hypothetical protein EOM23_03400 [Candidatus Moranbacteria bacterium]|nr:hypothetical protein [Candidatus Moranbacteria bacterium]
MNDKENESLAKVSSKSLLISGILTIVAGLCFLSMWVIKGPNIHEWLAFLSGIWIVTGIAQLINYGCPK